MNIKKIVSMLLAVILIMSMAACNNTGNNTNNTGPRDLDWLNTNGEMPIVKDGTEKTLKVAIQMYSDSGDPEGQWFYHPSVC